MQVFIFSCYKIIFIHLCSRHSFLLCTTPTSSINYTPVICRNTQMHQSWSKNYESWWTALCGENHLILNVNKLIEMIEDFKRKRLRSKKKNWQSWREINPFENKLFINRFFKNPFCCKLGSGVFRVDGCYKELLFSLVSNFPHIHIW